MLRTGITGPMVQDRQGVRCSIHLVEDKRDGRSHFVKRGGNYVDKETDENVAFTVTNGTKGYVTWTTPTAEPAPDPLPRLPHTA